MGKRRGILTSDQREAVESNYMNLTYHPSKMRSDIEEQIDSFGEDLRILKENDRELYEKVLNTVNASKS